MSSSSRRRKSRKEQEEFRKALTKIQTSPCGNCKKHREERKRREQLQ